MQNSEFVVVVDAESRYEDDDGIDYNHNDEAVAQKMLFDAQ